MWYRIVSRTRSLCKGGAREIKSKSKGKCAELVVGIK